MTTPTRKFRKGFDQEKCDSCRIGKQKPNKRQWPEKCKRCLEKCLACSEPKRPRSTSLYSMPASLSSTKSRPHTILAPKTESVVLSHSTTIVNRIPSNQLAEPLPCRPGYDPVLKFVLHFTNEMKDALLLLSYQTLLLKSLRELRILADDMTQAFTNDPDCLGCTTNPLGLSDTFSEYKRFSRVLSDMMSQLHAGELLAEARAVLSIDYGCPDISWGDEANDSQRVFDNILYWRNMGCHGFAHAIQMSRFPVHSKLVEVECQLFIQDRRHFLTDIEELEQRYGLSSQKPMGLRGSQAFIPKELLRIPTIAEHFRSVGRPDYLGRSISHALYDAGCSVVWSREHVNFIDVLGRTGLYLACNNGDELLVNHLLQLKANTEHIFSNGLTSLHLAASLGHERICERLWIHQNGSNRSVQDCNLYRDNQGRTPLMWAAWSGSLDTVRFFRCRSVDASLDCDFSNRTAIGLAAYRGHGDVIRYLSDRGFVFDIPDGQGRTPFWYAAGRSDCETMAILEGQGANVEHKDNQGLTPLAEAAKQGHSRALDYLLGLNNLDPINALASTDLFNDAALRPRIDINVKDHDGKSPLILATEARKAQSVRTLLEYGSLVLDINDINVAVAIARRNNDEETCGALLRYGALLF